MLFNLGKEATRVHVTFVFKINFSQNFIKILTADIILNRKKREKERKEEREIFNFVELSEFNYQDIIFNTCVRVKKLRQIMAVHKISINTADIKFFKLENTLRR